MDGSDHSNSSSSTLIKRFSTSKISSSDTGTNENDQNYRQIGMNLQNSKKPMTKHFMSPTISAASKVIAPRMKILAERNESSDTNIQKTSSLDNSEDSYSNDDSSLKPYHSLQKNYPSPRPQFLRYKPNRRREIVLQHENEVKEERIKRSSSGKDISLLSKKNEGTDLVCGSEIDEEIDEEDEEVREGEEEKEGFMRRVLKLMLLLFVLVLSTLYISSMNSNEASPALQAVEGLKDGYFRIHDHIYGSMRRVGGDNFVDRIEFRKTMRMFGVGSYFLDRNMDLLKVNQTFIGECIEEGREMVEDVYLVKVENSSDNLGKLVGLQAGDMEIEVEKIKGNSILGEIVGLEAGESEDVCVHETAKTGEDFAQSKIEKKRGNSILGEIVGFEAGESEGVYDGETAKTGEDFDHMVENFEFKETESIDNVESLKDNQIPILSYTFQEENEVAMEPVLKVNNLGDDEDLEMVESNETAKIENIADNSDNVFITERMDSEITTSGILNSEAESDFEVLLVIGLTIGLAIVASLVLVFHFKGKKKARKDSFPITNSCMNQSGVVEKHNSELQCEREEQIKRVESEYVESKEMNRSRAPSIKLLGEFSVVESCGLRSNSSTGEIEANSISLSYEDFTPQKKMINEEKVAAVMTPVRRSSRIRSRAN